jgi:ribonucleoside-triphosphate reductase (thioredoxin)
MYIRAASQDTQRKFVVPDSRDGWVESLRILLATFIVPKTGMESVGSYPVFVYDSIRPAGSVISGFGGVSQGK